MRVLPSHLAKVLASTIWIWIGPDQSQRGHGNIPVVIALRSISAKFTMLPHLGQIWALTHCFSEFIPGRSIQMLQSISRFLQSDPLIVDAFHESHESCSRNHASA